jgi:signal transduction histidine kinase
VASGAAAVSIATLLWALRVTDGARGAIAQWRTHAGELETKLGRADSVFGAHPGVVLIWEEGADIGDESDWGAPRAYGSTLALGSLLRFTDSSIASEPALRILHGLSGLEARNGSGQAVRLPAALARLRREGAPFSLRITSPGGVYIEADGRTAGPRAVVWITDASVKGVEENGAGGRLDDAMEVIARDPAAFLEMLADAPFLAFRLSSGMKLEWANKAYVAALEAKAVSTAIARNLLLDPQIAEQARRAMEEDAQVEDVRFVAIKGERRAMRIALFPVAGGVGGMAFDVTDLEEAKDNLQRHVKAHDETLNHLAEGVAVFGADKRLIFCNSAFAQMWDLDPAFLSERPAHGAWLDHLKERRLLPAHANYSEWRAGELALYQEVAELPDEPWVLEGGRTIRIARQRHPMGGLLLVFSDKTQELTLRSQYNHLLQTQKAALDRLYEGVIVFGLDGRLKLCNAAFQAQWGIEPAMLEGDVDFHALVQMCMPKFHKREVWGDIKARITDPSPAARQEFRGEMVRSDDTVLNFLTRPLPDGATLIAFIDNTAARRVEAALHERAEAFKAADRLKTDFVQNVSVQLRDPLQAIQGFSQMLAQRVYGPLNDRQQEHIDSVVQGAESLNKLVRDILDLATIEADELELDITAVDINSAVRDSAHLAMGRAKDTERKLTIECDPDIGVFGADDARVRQILFRLITNAVRETDAGDSISIKAERKGASVFFEVRDTGPGMSPADQAAAFDTFRSFDKEGAGLALTLVRSFVELHKGLITIDSHIGQGTAVKIILQDAHAVARAA